MAKIKQAFTPSQVALPTCGGCVQCGDLDDRHLYILGYNNKYYCKVCFFKMAPKWPKVQPYKKPYKGDSDGEGTVQEVQGDDRVQAGSERGLPADGEGREAELDRGLHG